MADFVLAQWSTQPSMYKTLEDETGAVINLETASSVRLQMASVFDGAIAVDAPCVILAPANAGNVRYDWAILDTQRDGHFNAWFVVIFIGGAELMVPDGTYLDIQVTRSLVAPTPF